MQFDSYRSLIFDFDGVLVDSNEIRFKGFELLFDNFPRDKIYQFMKYARSNSGLSRYIKIKYFFDNILGKPISDEKIGNLAKQYSMLVKQKVIEADPMEGSLEFLTRFHELIDMAIVSGSDEEELREICAQRGIARYFVDILGSPKSKEINISQLLSRKGWTKNSCVLIGDSINDFDAAKNSRISFIGFNSGVTSWTAMNAVVNVNGFSEIVLMFSKANKKPVDKNYCGG